MVFIPEYVIVKFSETTCPPFPGLRSGEVPIFPRSGSFQFGFPGMKSKVSIRRWQLPLVACYPYTSYKAQSKALPAKVTDLVPSHTFKVGGSFAYVPLLRVRCLDDLAIVRPFPISVLQKARPKDLIAQDARFKKMEMNSK